MRQALTDIIMRRRTPTAAAARASDGAHHHDDDEETAPLQPRKGGAQPAASAPPAPTCGCGAALNWRSEAAARCRPELGWAVAFLFIGWPILRYSGLVPGLVWRVLAVAGLAALAHRLLTFRRWADEHAYVGRFLLWFSAMVVELLVENCLVWVVSATDRRKYEDVPALQDNAEAVLSGLAAASPLARWLLYGDWVHTKEFLAAALLVAFSVAYDQVPYSGFGLMARWCASIACGRLLRVACFLTTVLPSPRPGCYSRRFPPPPDTLKETLRVGFTTLRGTGGCNDLIFSGHGAFWTLTPLLLSTYYPGRAYAPALVWVALVQSSLRDFLELQHYSVDMLLAVVVTAAVWGWARRVYPECTPLPRRAEGAPADAPNPAVLALIAFTLVTAAVAILVAKA